MAPTISLTPPPTPSVSVSIDLERRGETPDAARRTKLAGLIKFCKASQLRPVLHLEASDDMDQDSFELILGLAREVPGLRIIFEYSLDSKNDDLAHILAFQRELAPEVNASDRVALDPLNFNDAMRAISKTVDLTMLELKDIEDAYRASRGNLFIFESLCLEKSRTGSGVIGNEGSQVSPATKDIVSALLSLYCEPATPAMLFAMANAVTPVLTEPKQARLA